MWLKSLLVNDRKSSDIWKLVEHNNVFSIIQRMRLRDLTVSILPTILKAENKVYSNQNQRRDFQLDQANLNLFPESQDPVRVSGII